MEFDVVIIGSGITGAFIARNLSKYELKVALLDASNDVGNKTTSANSAIIHSGYDPVPGTLKAKFNVLGNKMFEQISKELDVSFKRIGSLTLAFNEDNLKTLETLKARSIENGVEVKILSKEETLAMEPNISPDVLGALYAPTCGIVDPFLLCVKAVENAMDNGVNLFLNNKVIDIKKEDGLFKVITNKDTFTSKVVINAAGLHSDEIASMIEDISWKITPRKGEYFLLEHFDNNFIKHTLFPLPSEKGKGVLVSPTYSGDYIIGPSSELVDDKDDVSTDKDTLAAVKNAAKIMVPNIPYKELIRTYSGVRATPSSHDFIIEYAHSDNHFINVCGIESPGLVSSPAIGEYVVEELVKPILNMTKKANYNPYVRPRVNKSLDVINKDKDFSTIICNCEKVSLGEIKDALARNCAPTTIKGVKRRTRAGYGKCQGGFCQSKIVFLLAEHYHVSPLDICLAEEDSNILTSIIKEVK